VRELRNAMEQAAVLASGSVLRADDLRLPRSASDAELPRAASAGEEPVDSSFRDAKRRATEDFERDYLIRALRSHDGNISRTAEAIGMVRQSLQQKIRELGLRAASWTGDDD